MSSRIEIHKNRRLIGHAIGLVVMGFGVACHGFGALQRAPMSAVLGLQDLANLAPEDVRPGALILRGVISSTDKNAFALKVTSGWGTFTYRGESEGGYPYLQEAGQQPLIPSAGHMQALRGATDLPYATWVTLVGKSVSLVGVIDEVERSGDEIAGAFLFSGERVRLRLTLEKRDTDLAKPVPTRRNIAYGPHWRQTIDFYSAKTERPAPLLVYIHGGGWVGGDKSTVAGYGISQYLEQGISVAAINYRRVTDAAEFAVNPPVKYPMHDSARAIQVLRHQALELNIDKTRLALAGGSAGACTSLWIAMHDDLAQPESEDEVSRESTRVTCAAVIGAQTSLDPHQLRDWIPDMTYGGHAFGLLPRDDKKESFQRFWELREQLLPSIKRYSPFELASSDDPPVYLQYSDPNDATHSPVMGAKLKEKLDRLGVACEFRVFASRPAENSALAAYVISRLKTK